MVIRNHVGNEILNASVCSTLLSVPGLILASDNKVGRETCPWLRLAEFLNFANQTTETGRETHPNSPVDMNVIAALVGGFLVNHECFESRSNKNISLGDRMGCSHTLL